MANRLGGAPCSSPTGRRQTPFSPPSATRRGRSAQRQTATAAGTVAAEPRWSPTSRPARMGATVVPHRSNAPSTSAVPAPAAPWPRVAACRWPGSQPPLQSEARLPSRGPCPQPRSVGSRSDRSAPPPPVLSRPRMLAAPVSHPSARPSTGFDPSCARGRFGAPPCGGAAELLDRGGASTGTALEISPPRTFPRSLARTSPR